jgi:hypothetical protein
MKHFEDTFLQHPEEPIVKYDDVHFRAADGSQGVMRIPKNRLRTFHVKPRFIDGTYISRVAKTLSLDFELEVGDQYFIEIYK